MGDHHVPEGAGRVVFPPLDGQRLGHVDLDVVDEVPAPDRLEEPVGEAQGEDVQRRFPCREVIDAEDLILIEDLVDHRVQLTGGFEVGAEAFP